MNHHADINWPINDDANVSCWQISDVIYRQYLIVKATTLFFCTLLGSPSSCSVSDLLPLILCSVPCGLQPFDCLN